jgi:hypothetical protein
MGRCGGMTTKGTKHELEPKEKVRKIHSLLEAYFPLYSKVNVLLSAKKH